MAAESLVEKGGPGLAMIDGPAKLRRVCCKSIAVPILYFKLAIEESK